MINESWYDEAVDLPDYWGGRDRMNIQYTPDLSGILREVFHHGVASDRLYVQSLYGKASITRITGSYIRIWGIKWDITSSDSLPVTAVRRTISGVMIRVRYREDRERYLRVEEG